MKKTQVNSNKLEQREAELALISSVQQGLLAKKEMKAIYELVGDRLRDLFDSQVTGIYTFDHDADLEHFQYLFEDGERLFPESRPLNQLRKYIIRHKGVLLINEDADAIVEKITGDKHEAIPGTRLPKSLLFVPLMMGDRVTGCLSLQNLDREHAFLESDVQLLSTLANSISIALENARYFSETEQRNAELAVINSVQEGLVAEMDMQGIYDLVGDKVRDLFDAQGVIIAALDHHAETERFYFALENGERHYPEPRPFDKFRQRLIKTKKMIWVNENVAEAYTTITGEAPKAVPGTRFPKSVVFVPLLIGDMVRGYVSLQNMDREQAFSEADVRLLSTLANSMSVALENARLFNETEQRLTELHTVNNISRAMVSHLELDALIHLVGEQMKETFKADIVYIALYDRENDTIFFPYEYGDKNKPRKFGDGFTERIITSNQPLLINKDLAETREQLKSKQLGRVTSSFLGVPIQTGDVPNGVISVQSTEEENRFDENDLRLLSTIAANVSVFLQNAEAYQKLSSALDDLRAAQEQLVQQEKLASLGQLTAGIAHEIKNPLNFVNNFSDVSMEMIDEALEAIKTIDQNGRGDPSNPSSQLADVSQILADIKANLAKIHEHGTRADSIVKSMLQHSRGGDGKMEPTPLNPLIREYVNLSFHGMRAGKDPINVDIDLQLDESIGEVPLIAEDFSRVILNLCNNAFDAMREWGAVHKHEVRSQVPDIVKAKPSAKVAGIGEQADRKGGYKPELTVRTRRVAKDAGENVASNGGIRIEIEDNGPGIPNEIRDNILQPFFTTKKGTQGTGLGLSITHDIIKAHGGELKVETKEGAGSTFIIQLPQPTGQL